MHTNYQPARRGLEATRIMVAKRLRLTKNLCQPMVGDELLDCVKAEMQHKHLRYSDRGDFTRCYRGGF
ncbi:hypothetical protein HOR78_gp07 [Pseudomonas phage KNP]|uniref:Uncharacterized protein n=3 Tax=Studiervirinae TaxID=2731653 RepID=A0A1W6JRR4_9CAUD|nr:hypothetical protein HOR77_gp07 [Pseudomonas phage WRT]YP_009790492.1 hypothetical protein HOR78_gp07 [Pseudomonas phage KNP]QNJ57441.1 hypothetical protein [Pseudomonas phage Waldo5]UFK26785.1 hypothetical protein PstGM1_07 [Pseudomonas phage Pst_GM1]UFK26834.1 hypothetical protein PstGIL1_07 [Pseudomonas phage Pst_GIL1]ARM69571.1 hypothetical protein WRT_007 [Pseudomonas phage WRT]ARM69620.1 hypothetical protein KNP_007 [Pseudomonas phage KNP]